MSRMFHDGGPSKEFQSRTVMVCANRTPMAIPAQHVLPQHHSTPLRFVSFSIDRATAACLEPVMRASPTLNRM